VKIGIVVDGKSEFASLPCLYSRIHRDIEHVLLNPVHADIQPLAPLPVIARACLKPALLLQKRGADHVVVLVDRERRRDCCKSLAQAVAGQLVKYGLEVPVDVVIKDRQFENWLIAAVGALKSQPKRFSVSRTSEATIAPNKADNVSAVRLLKQMALDDYDKVQDSKRILSSADPLEMARNSRSFRKLLRCVDHPNYREQSRLPS
jgi:Domain of unknown function (DUF4276)